MSAFLSLLGLTTRGDAEEAAALRIAWNGVFDIDRTRSGWIAFCLIQAAEPVTARTPAELGTAIREAWIAAGRR